MIEFINGTLFINNKLVQQNFLLKDHKIFLEYPEKTYETEDIKGQIVAHGFIDLHVHIRVPGQEEKEDVEHVTKAALAGGYTTLVAMANLVKEVNNLKAHDEVQEILDKSSINIIQVARVTNGNSVVDFKTMAENINIFSDDGEPLLNDLIMAETIKKASENKSLILLHEQNEVTSGHAYKSFFTKKFNIKTVPNDYEFSIINRDINLNKKYNAKLHFQHLSSKESVSLIKEAKNNNMNITSEVTPHHLYFSNEDIKKNDGALKMNPPLNSEVDRKSLVKGLKSGIIDIIATDHAPHTFAEKNRAFSESLFGVIGLESAFGASNKILGVENMAILLTALTTNPGKLLGIEANITNGMKANIVFIDPNEKWIFKKTDIKSKSSNSPFLGKELLGKIKKVIYNKNI